SRRARSPTSVPSWSRARRPRRSRSPTAWPPSTWSSPCARRGAGSRAYGTRGQSSSGRTRPRRSATTWPGRTTSCRRAGPRATGDLEVDYHHTVEDVGLALGVALRDALGEKAGIRRFGEATVPLDEALVTSVVDLSGRPFLVYDVRIKQAKIGTFDVELVNDFLLAMTNQAGMNLHVRMASGRNPHHIVEATFKSLARALDLATQRDPRVVGVLSTKGLL